MLDKDQLGSDQFEQEHNPVKQSASASRPFLSFSVLEGFRCFFQDAVLGQGLSYHQCYERVMGSHFQLEKIRIPTGSLLRSGGSFDQRSGELYRRSSARERFYLQSGDNIFKYSLGQDKEKEITQLQRQLELYQRSAEEALVEKRRQLKSVREEKERVHEREEEERRRREAVLKSLQSQKSS